MDQSMPVMAHLARKPQRGRRRRVDREAEMRAAIAAIKAEYNVSETSAYAMFVQASVAA